MSQKALSMRKIKEVLRLSVSSARCAENSFPLASESGLRSRASDTRLLRTGGGVVENT
jgi:hypothetical protein